MRTVCVDLDGVLNLYDGWKGPEHLADPRPGALEFLATLASNDETVVTILTTRWPDPVWEWLEQHNMDAYVDYVTDIKPPATIYIDDRAFTFTGDFDAALEATRSFKAHWED